MKTIIKEEKRYERGKSEITYWVRIKLTKWYEKFFGEFWIYEGSPIGCFDTLKEARRCKELYDQGKWEGKVYSKVIK